MRKKRKLQVFIPETLDARLRKAAQHQRISVSEWVRRALDQALREGGTKGARFEDPLGRLASLGGPTADIERMLAEIGWGRK
jgi:hypothetical protein